MIYLAPIFHDPGTIVFRVLKKAQSINEPNQVFMVHGYFLHSKGNGLVPDNMTIWFYQQRSKPLIYII
ncbi:MAG: hypothetical protein CMH46_00870 [Muricauda sp.]|nr:hypothetical protein [Allomuricauda sp.]